MSREDERDDVGSYVGFGQAAARLRVLGVEQQCQEIARRFASAVQEALAALNDAVDHGIKKLERRAAAPPAEPGQKGWRAQEIERIEAPETVEISCHSPLEFAHFAPEPWREQRLL